MDKGFLDQNDDNVIEPITAADFRAWSRFDLHNENQIIDILIRTAREQSEEYANLSLITKSYTLYFDDFPTNSEEIKLPRSPLTAVTTVQYYDAAGTLQTFDASNYQVDTVRRPGRIKLTSSASWPAVEQDKINAVQITFSAGFGAEPRHVPETYKTILLFFVKHMFERRDPDQNSNMPKQIKSMLFKEKVKNGLQ